MLNALALCLALQTKKVTQDEIQKFLIHIQTCAVCHLDNKDYKFKLNNKDVILTADQIKQHKKKFELYNK